MARCVLPAATCTREIGRPVRRRARRYRFASGDVYEGEYKAGVMDGTGTMRYANGNVYEGEFKAA